MYGDTAPAGSVSDLHRYFPEWADRPPGPNTQLESDRNSYLACGYADEFGYGAYAGRPPAIAPLDGDPEGSILWREQIGALHPGYPQCPKPLDRYRREAPRELFAARQPLAVRRAAVAIGVIQVGRGDQPALAQAPFWRMALRIGVVSLLAERLIRRRHLNDVI